MTKPASAETSGLTRRSALIGVSAAGAAGAGGVFAWLRARGYEIDPAPSPVLREPGAPVVRLSGPPFDPRAKETLSILLTRLFPGDPKLGLPSADEVGLLGYVERAARQPGLRPIRDDLLKLARFLDGKSKPARFVDLDVAEQTQLILSTQSDAQPTGRFVPSRAIEVALRFGLEGYLGHPHHGGNRDFASWRALDIGMPRERTGHGGHGGHGGE